MDRNPSPPRLSAEEIELIEGDKIGETVFSKKWALTTLMKLVQSLQSGQPNHDGSEEEGCKDKSIDETLDAELCELWDMSMNPVCCMLIELRFVLRWLTLCDGILYKLFPMHE